MGTCYFNARPPAHLERTMGLQLAALATSSWYHLSETQETVVHSDLYGHSCVFMNKASYGRTEQAVILMRSSGAPGFVQRWITSVISMSSGRMVRSRSRMDNR